MKILFVSICTGVLVGVIYAVLNVKSPAPPVVALLGLLGMLAGEQAVPLIKRIWHKEPITAAWWRQECLPKMTGIAPKPAAVVAQPTPPPSAAQQVAQNSPPE